jgi:hypothetical protein
MSGIIIAGMQQNPLQLRNFFHHRQIVQQYPPREEEEISLAPSVLAPHRLFF